MADENFTPDNKDIPPGFTRVGRKDTSLDVPTSMSPEPRPQENITSEKSKLELPPGFARVDDIDNPSGDISDFFIGGSLEVSKASPTVAGAFMGAKLGAAAGATTGPFAPVLIPTFGLAGLLIGGGAGYFAGSAIEQQVAKVLLPEDELLKVYEDRSEVPIKERPFIIPTNPAREAGRTFWGSMVYAGAPYTGLIKRTASGAIKPLFAVPAYKSAEKGASFLSKTANVAKQSDTVFYHLLNSMVKTAGKNPRAYMIGETVLSGSASIGAFAAESVFPGETLPRIGGEIGATVLSPIRISMAGIRNTYKLGKFAYNNLSQTGRENQAVAWVKRIIAESGENVDDILLNLANPPQHIKSLLDSGIDISSGILSRSDGLKAIENRLTQLDSRWGSEVAANKKKLLQGLGFYIRILENSGNPQALRAAAAARVEYEKSVIDSYMSERVLHLKELASKIDSSEATSLSQFGINVNKILNNVYKTLSKIEDDHWDKVDRTLPATGFNVVKKLNQIRHGAENEDGVFIPPEILEDSELDSLILKTIDDISDNMAAINVFGPTDKVQLTTNTLILLRRRLGRLAIKEVSDTRGRNDIARIYSELSQAILDDLDSAPDFGDDFLAAREFSKHFRDVVHRTFAGEALGINAKGGDVIPPEMLMVKAFTPGGRIGKEGANLRFQELAEAAKAAGDDLFQEMVIEQEQTLRAIARSVIETKGENAGRINPDKLAKWMFENQELLKRFPHLIGDLKNAATAEKFFSENISSAAATAKKELEKSALSRMLESEDPARFIGQVFSGKNPEKEFASIVRMAKRDPEAFEGLKTSVFSWAYDVATSTTDGTFSWKRYNEVLNGKLSPTGPTLLDLVRKHNLYSKGNLDLINEYLIFASEVEESASKGAALLENLAKNDAGTLFGIRMLGARLGTLLADFTGGHALVVTGGVNRFLTQALDSAPRGKVKDIVIQMHKDPAYMRKLLSRDIPPKKRLELGLQTHAFLWRAGVNGIYEDFQTEEEFVE